jgi:hypothetical protein
MTLLSASSASSLDATCVRDLLRAGTPGEQAYGRCSSLTDEQLNRVVAHTGSVDFAAIALRFRPWPEWLHELLFPIAH